MVEGEKWEACAMIACHVSVPIEANHLVEGKEWIWAIIMQKRGKADLLVHSNSFDTDCFRIKSSLCGCWSNLSGIEEFKRKKLFNQQLVSVSSSLWQFWLATANHRRLKVCRQFNYSLSLSLPPSPLLGFRPFRCAFWYGLIWLDLNGKMGWHLMDGLTQATSSDTCAGLAQCKEINLLSPIGADSCVWRLRNEYMVMFVESMFLFFPLLRTKCRHSRDSQVIREENHVPTTVRK